MRLAAAMHTDVVLQQRNRLYAISVAVSVIVGGALAWLSPLDALARTVPMALLMFVGGSTLLYVVAMVILERDDGTLAAISVSPLRPWEYLASKVVTLTGIATLEGVLILLAGLMLLSRSGPVPWPNPLVVVGLASLSVLHVLVGIVLVVRYRRFMEVIVPMSLVATVLQLPAFYFVGALDHPAILAIPTAAPTMFIRAAFVPLRPWEWGYALLGTIAVIAGSWWWSLRAFERHVIGGEAG